MEMESQSAIRAIDDIAPALPEDHPVRLLRNWLSSQIVGQEHLVQRLLIALLADGHLLVEGAPGLAKTKAIRTLAEGVEGDFHRIQFTPDLLPGDITGTDVFRPEDGSFAFQKGPIFHNMILADEVNRAPAKVQSALLEAMAERQVSVGARTWPLPDLFLVMATQNPIEQEGTYPLPEAQLDRFLLHVRVEYPSVEAEKRILDLAREELRNPGKPPQQILQKEILEARQSIQELHLSEAVVEYIVQLIAATRGARDYGKDLGDWIEYGASPRGSIALERCARASAWLEGRDFVSPDDVQTVAHDVLRHRLILSFEAEAQALTPDRVIDALLERVPVA